MQNLPIFAIDFEGNGQNGVWEAGMVRLLGEELDEPWEVICPAGRPAPPSPFPIPKPGPSGQRVAAFAAHFSFLRRRRELGLLASHGGSTEAFLLRRQWPSPGFVPDWLVPGQQTISWGPWVDSRLLGSLLFPGHRLGLQALLQASDLGNEWLCWGKKFCHPVRRRPHRALYDAIGCALLIREYRRRTGEGPRQLLLRCLPGRLQSPCCQPELFAIQ
ncbi:MAG: hypothetical protein LBP65_04335 [Puniceicoccales bacterium]|jgi:hypothetical protein|nr:hypothetical protein [Puniceicoccales bacterium]